MRRIYLDTAAATPMEKRVRRRFERALNLANPSSIHQEGVVAKEELELARREVANFLQVQPDEIIFTASGTESNNLAVLGVARALSRESGAPGHLIVSAIEHSSVLEAARTLESEGWDVTFLTVDQNGLINPDDLKAALTPHTRLVSIMYANNEIGTIEPLVALRRVIDQHRKKAKTPWPYFHTDACQAARFLPLGIPQLGVDLLTLNGSKVYGPRGSALLYKHRRVPCRSLISGGGQEHNLRSGTENVAAAAGLACALTLCQSLREAEGARLTELRDYFINRLLDLITDTQINGSVESRLPNNINLLVPGVNAEWLVIALDQVGVACSTGSACSFNTKDESYVIIALGKDKRAAESSLRFSLGRQTTKKQLDYVARQLSKLVSQARTTQSLLRT